MSTACELARSGTRPVEVGDRWSNLVGLRRPGDGLDGLAFLSSIASPGTAFRRQWRVVAETACAASEAAMVSVPSAGLEARLGAWVAVGFLSVWFWCVARSGRGFGIQSLSERGLSTGGSDLWSRWSTLRLTDLDHRSGSPVGFSRAGRDWMIIRLPSVPAGGAFARDVRTWQGGPLGPTGPAREGRRLTTTDVRKYDLRSSSLPFSPNAPGKSCGLPRRAPPLGGKSCRLFASCAASCCPVPPVCSPGPFGRYAGPCRELASGGVRAQTAGERAV